MSVCSHHEMTNHHDFGAVERLGELLHIWRRRFVERGELAAWTERDLNDVGLSRDDVALEIDKPFWRA
ncbi:DUF1127 domain-containing protein [Bradyrhizobium sp. U87765 SZCCT0131]|nr:MULTISPECIES: DUF1127 domain-containing protein [unclassified Bradyrhizobium]MBR1222702.1 DUF1127 domain-containing protein [Bradyrhizobium sp. U87765 SZCCT0131]MBR1265217.1 DUF1127 domain-containing protein [Bradyrhizobium sp. U87765 SZCCT0134]MBR1303004.1 DUF1127 domain-containing protein [Bradyrhizobium sp. U87765 SZCCT0110]MBR1323702.1 DUF1127 domain-containing protein [Bradyrhizobium sp. U87765 SZCCT0109]MBR1346933.1 DUF1127 domain-containing protein [Bradyrhizobium sp. U87765 SZCCT004